MRRTLFGGLIAAALALPAGAFAAQARGNPDLPQSQQNGMRSPQSLNPRVSIGAGQLGNSVPAHTDAPGATKIDNDSRAPVNDVQVGQGTTDTPQNKNPPPARP
jgi:hypothetical protein